MKSLVKILEESSFSENSKATQGVLKTMVDEILLLAEAICVERDRFEIAAKLAEQGVEITNENVSAFEMKDADIELRLARHTSFYEQIFKRLSDSINAN